VVKRAVNRQLKGNRDKNRRNLRVFLLLLKRVVFVRNGSFIPTP